VRWLLDHSNYSRAVAVLILGTIGISSVSDTWDIEAHTVTNDDWEQYVAGLRHG
jgi:hypothetical protein